MKAGDRIRLINMPKNLKEFEGRKGIVTSYRIGRPYVGVKLDGDFRMFPMMESQVEKIK